MLKINAVGLAAVILAAISSSPVHAATWTGGGSNNLWSNPDNWGGTAPVPGTGETLFFDGNTRLTPNNDFTGASFGGITFNQTAAAFVLTGNSLTLSGPIMHSLSAAPQAINLPLAFPANPASTTIDVGTGILTIGGNISGGPLVKTGPGTLVLKGQNTYVGQFNATTGTGTTISGGTIEVGTGGIAATCQLIFNGAGGGGQTLHVTSDLTNSTQLQARAGGVSAAFDVDAGVTMTMAAPLRTDQGAAVQKKGLGTLVLNAQNNQLDNNVQLLTGTLVLPQAGGAGGQAGASRITSSADTILLLRNNTDANYGNASTGAGNVEHLTVSGSHAMLLDRAAPGAGTTHFFNDITFGGDFALNITAGPNVTSGIEGLNINSVTPATVAATLNGNAVFDVANPAAAGASTLLTLGSTGNPSVTGAGRNLTIQGTGSTLIPGNITTGIGSVIKNGAGKLTLGGTNTYSGTTTLSGGILNFNSSANLGDASVTNTVVLGGGTLQPTGTVDLTPNRGLAMNLGGGTIDVPAGASLTISGPVSGSDPITKIGSGTLVLSNANNTFSGTTALTAGTLTVSGTYSGSAVTIASGTTLNGTGAIGAAAVNGTLTGSLTTGPLQVNSNGSVAGTLTTGLVDINSGGTVSPGGNSIVGTMNTGAFTLKSGGIVAFDLNTPASSDLIAVTGNLDLNGGTLNISNALIVTGTYTLFTYTGTLVHQNLAFGNVPAGFTLALDYSTVGQVKLTATLPTFRTWTGAGANTNWSNPANWDGGTAIPAAGASVMIAAAGTTVTVDIAVDINTLNINRNTDLTINSSGAGTLGIRSAGLLITGAAGITLSSPVALLGNQTWSLGSGSIAASGVISGNFALNKGGAGTLTLSGNNTYGNTTVSTGTLQVGNGGSAGTLGTGNITNNGTLNINRTGSMTIAGTIGGSGAIVQLGTGTLRLNGANTYTGSTTVLAGLLQLGNAGALGDTAAGTTIFTGAALDLNGFTMGAEPLTLGGTGIANSGVIYNSSSTAGGTSGAIALTADSLLVASSGAVTLGGAMSGSSALTKNGTAAFTLGGANTFTGTLTVNAGMLKLGHASALGDPSGPTVLVGDAALDLNGQTIGAETLTAGGTGVANSGVILNGSASAAAFGGAINLTADSTINSGTGGITLNGIISGAVNLSKEGAGTLALTANNSYTGNTTIVAGTLKAGSPAISMGPSTTLGAVPGGTVTVSAGATLDIGGHTTANINPLFGAKQLFISGAGVGGIGAIINTGGVNQQNAFQSITLNADATVGGPNRIDLRNGTPVLNLQTFTLTKVGASQFTLVGCTVNGTGNIVVNQGLAGAASFSIETTSTMTTAGSITLNSGASLGFFSLTGTVTTPIVVNAANVVIGPNGNNINTCASPITLNANATFMALNGNGTGTLILTGNITESGSRSIVKNANGTGTDILALAGSNTYTGTTTTNGGTLQLGNGGASGNLGTGDVINNANLSFNRGDTFVVPNIISGSGNVIQNGGGTTSLTATNTYSGATTVNGGTLQVGNGGTAGTLGTGPITTNATLAYNRTDNLNVGVSIGGTGGVAQNGSGSLTLSGANTFTGPATVNAGVLTVGATGSLAGTALVNNGRKLVVLGSLAGAVTVNGSLAATPASAGSQLRGTGLVDAVQSFDVIANNAVVWPGTASTSPTLLGTETLTCTTCNLTTGGKLAVIVKNNFGPLFNQKLVTTGTLAPTLALDATSTLSIATGNTNNHADSFVIVDTGPTTKGITTSFAHINAGALVQGTDYDLIYRDSTAPLDIKNPLPGTILMDANAVSHPVNQIVVSFKNTSVSPATVSAFHARPEAAGVLLEWNAISEFKNAGFDLYRRASTDSHWTKINPSLIPGRITNPDPHVYRFVDWPESGVYEYKLDSVGIQSAAETSQECGPATLDADMFSASMLSLGGLNASLATLESIACSARTVQLTERFTPMRNEKARTHAHKTFEETPASLTELPPIATGVREIKSAVDAAARLTVPRPSSGMSANDAAIALRAFSSARVSQAGFTAAKVVYDKPGLMLIPQALMPAGYDLGRVMPQREGRSVTPLALTPAGLLVYGPGYSDEYTNKDALFLRPSISRTSAGTLLHAQGLFSSTQEVNVTSPATAVVEYHDIYFDFNYRPYTYAPWFSNKYLTFGTTQTFDIGTPLVSGGPARLTVNVWSLTESDDTHQDHNLMVVVNGKPAGTAQWSGGNKMMELTFEVGTNVLNDTNQIELVTPPINGVDKQIAFLHSIRVDYTQRLDGARPLTIANAVSRSKLYEVSNLPSANAWVVDTRYPDRAALAPVETQPQADGTYKVRFVAHPGGGGTYLVVPAGQENRPLSVSKRTVKPLKSGLAHFSTGPGQFNTGIQPLLAARSKEGLRAAFIDQEQIFDYYGYGRYGPAAIQKAVRATRPQYLLLLGRTTYDYNNYGGLDVDPLCPAFLVSTTFWAQATSDSLFGDLGRGYPEVAVGRLPVNDSSELRNAVTRILSYAGLSGSGVRMHAAADKADPEAGNFPAQSDLIAQSNPELFWQRNYLGITSQIPADVTAGLADAANGGADLLLYTGHGNASHLGAANRQILDGTDVASWRGNVVLLQATCTANWMAKNEAGFKSIAIQALTQPQGGISASIASSTYMNSGMAAEFMSQLIKNAHAGCTRWGTALMHTQRWAFSQTGSGFYQDLGKTEQIFGDPAMPVYSKRAGVNSSSRPPAPGQF